MDRGVPFRRPRRRANPVSRTAQGLFLPGFRRATGGGQAPRKASRRTVPEPAVSLGAGPGAVLRDRKQVSGLTQVSCVRRGPGTRPHNRAAAPSRSGAQNARHGSLSFQANGAARHFSRATESARSPSRSKEEQCSPHAKSPASASQVLQCDCRMTGAHAESRADRTQKSLLACLGPPSGRHKKRPACVGARHLTTRSPGLQATTVLNSVCAKGRVFGYPDEERHPRDERETGLKIE